jgi:hypothetical protein
VNVSARKFETARGVTDSSSNRLKSSMSQ